ncbi:MAG TPA: ATP-binding cassette domain-containing protein [Thermoanaerobaculia bacterium]|jgi:branched-chain amino acid transport system ATP-binding protein|nr:ATP-binding cassette domain-containing protein [Thermoanaerobaculia bacterium]
MVAMLKVRNISKSFGGVSVIRDLSLTVLPGEILGIIGPNGAGKSTLFKLIGGFLRVDCGQMNLLGLSLVRMAPYAICRAGIALTFQHQPPIRYFKVRDLLSLACMLGRSRKIADAGVIEELARALNIESVLDSDLAAIGHPQVKRVHLARAFLTKPKILFVDEIFAGQDAEDSRIICSWLLEARRSGLTIVLADHQIGYLAASCDKMAFLVAGSIDLTGPTEEVLNDSAVRQAYLL